MTTCFESISVDLLYEIFDFLSAHHIRLAFNGLNEQYNTILRERFVHVRLDPVDISSNIFRTCYLTHILPDCAHQIVSITIVQKWTLDIGQLFLNHQPTGLEPYVNLRALKLIHVEHALFARLLDSASRRLQTLIVKIDNWRRPNNDSELESFESTWLVRALNTLPNLYVCHMDDYHWRRQTSINIFEPFEHVGFPRLFSLTINECMSLAFLNDILERTPHLRRLRVRFVCPANDQHKQNLTILDGSTIVPYLRRLTVHVDCGFQLESALTFFSSVLPRLSHLSLIACVKNRIDIHQVFDGFRLIPSLLLLSSECMLSFDLLTTSFNDMIGLDTLLATLPVVSKSAVFSDERHVIPVPDVTDWRSFRIVCGNNCPAYRHHSTEWLGAIDNLRRIRCLELNDPARDEQLNRMLDAHDSLNELQYLSVLGSRMGPVEPLVDLFEKIMSQAPYLNHLSLAHCPLTVQRLLSLTNYDSYALFSHIRHLTLDLCYNGADEPLVNLTLRFSNLRVLSIMLYTMETLPAILSFVEHLKHLTLLRIDRMDEPDSYSPLTIEMLCSETLTRSAHVQTFGFDGFVIWL